MDYKRNKKYFETVKIKPFVIMIIIGLLAGLANAAGFILLILGIALLVMKLKGRPTDSEIDQVYASEVNGIKEKALKKLGLDEDEVKAIEPIVFDGNYFPNIQKQSWYTRGKDEVVRASNYQAVALFFSEEQVYSYTYAFSIIGDEKREATDEYFYRDIVSASTKTDNVEVNFGGKVGKENVTVDEFILTTSGGTSISATLRDHNDADRSIRAMKQLLRQKKSAI